ncbi:MAG: CHAT domain-containing protein [Bacteroidia bacterium]|nr:CHAT domain-containing protein [Bacteroidia bacterium]
MLKRLFTCGILFCATCISGSGSNPSQFQKLGSRIQNLSSAGNISGLLRLADSLQNSLQYHLADTAAIAEINYYSGVCFLLTKNNDKALVNLKRCINAKRQAGISDENYLKALFNAGTACNLSGDYLRAISYMKDYVILAADMYGENTGEVADAYSILAGASIECIDYQGFIEYSFKALNLLGMNKDALSGIGLSNLYNTIGVGYARMGDFAKARLYLEKSELLTNEYNLPHDENYINLINSLAYTYGSMGLTDKEKEYYKRGIDLAINNTSIMAFNLINSYAINIGKTGNVRKGAGLLSDIVKEAKQVYGIDSRLYNEVLNNYATYLVTFNYETANSMEVFRTLLGYLSRHKNDVVMRQQVLWGYAKALHETGNNENALNVIRELLFRPELTAPTLQYENPVLDSITADKSSLKVLQLKYDILWSLYNGSEKQYILEAAAGTSELIIALIEKLRLSISEEESRIILGDRYRDSYLFAIRDFELCYRKTGDQRFLEKAFEYAEKSKVAGLLAATRQMKAVEFQIPQQLAEREKLLLQEIGFYNSRIFSENEKEKPDKSIIAVWKENLLVAVAARDSLVMRFERDYPGYFTLKYNNRVPQMDDIPSIIGRNYNYINYVVSDSVLFVFLVNRKYQKLLTFSTDSTFIKNLCDFRNLLSDPSQSEAARTKFNNYQQIGFDLYRILIEPIKKYFISDNLLISPDNILSYLPFETFLSSKYTGSGILYRKLDYLMNDYNISYAYSATFMKETIKRDFFSKNRLIAFAPSYSPSLNIDSLISERESENILNDLPYARQEADYVAGISNGQLYLNNEASERTYKSEAANYSIIHLAMHTIVDDQNPMNSAMIFAQVKDSIEDGLLHTYEVYGIPLKSKMVVLSSCNTGIGTLSSGEGILSLARGFLYSGSQSVVMSLWRIEDRSGTDIIKMFYNNLEKGMSKSKALHKSRHEYLRTASQLRSHPYFWSTLVIFGDDAAVFIPWKIITGSSILVIISALSVFFYFRKRRYS